MWEDRNGVCPSAPFDMRVTVGVELLESFPYVILWGWLLSVCS